MLTKKKGDRVPKENIRDYHPKYFTVESWLRDRELWSEYPTVRVMDTDFYVDSETHRLYVNKTAKTSQSRWVGGSVRLDRIYDGWLRAEFDENIKFGTADVAKDKHFQLVNLLYKLVKVDDIVPEAWWNTD